MRRALLGIAGLSLTACGAFAVKSYDIAQVQKDFMACMNATAAPATAVDFDNKVDACQHAAWSSARARSYS